MSDTTDDTDRIEDQEQQLAQQTSVKLRQLADQLEMGDYDHFEHTGELDVETYPEGVHVVRGQTDEWHILTPDGDWTITREAGP